MTQIRNNKTQHHNLPANQNPEFFHRPNDTVESLRALWGMLIKDLDHPEKKFSARHNIRIVEQRLVSLLHHSKK